MLSIGNKYPSRIKPRIIRELSEISPPWGPVGYVVFKRTYARMIPAYGRTEDWHETVERCVNGLLEIGARFNQTQIEQLAYFWYMLKGSLAGRPTWQLGTNTVRRFGGDSLNNCWTVCINNPIDPFCFAFNELMLGGGVGFNIMPEHVYELPPVRFNVNITRIDSFDCDFVVPDNREGWIELLRRVLECFFYSGKNFSYNTLCIRDKGRPIVGFGGVASGPEELVKGINWISGILQHAHGRKLRPTECMWIMNIVGFITCSGNVRRCFPATTMCHTFRGLKSIDEIEIGDKVQTLNGYKKVTNVFKQGKQKLISVILSNGKTIRCTPNHKFAVLEDMSGEIEWVEARFLNQDDVLILNGKPCGDIGEMICGPTEAYFLGNFLGDGSVYIRSGREGTVTFALTNDETGGQIAQNIHFHLSAQGLNGVECIEPGNSLKIRVYDIGFAEEMIRYRVPHQCPIIPERIYKGDFNIRAAFLAGLCDADGTPNKYNLCSSKYPEFLVEVQRIATSLGIDTYIHTRPLRELKATGKTYDPENCLIIRGFVSRQHACDLINPHMVKQFTRKDDTRFDVSIPTRFAEDALERGWITKSEFNEMTFRSVRLDKGPRNPTHKQLCKFDQFWRDVIPVGITEIIDEDEEEETWDIEVEDDHSFFAEGVLVHNSAEVAIGSYEDIEFLQAKNWYLKNIPPWAQMSNNTVQTSAIELLPECFWDGYEGRGEPYGLLNIDLCRQFGRLIDGKDYRPDYGVIGANPCMEQYLENYEACNLSEIFLPNIIDVGEFGQVAELLLMANKTISCLPFIYPKTNEVVSRNHRIGIGVTGFLQATHLHDSDIFDAVYSHLEDVDERISRDMNIGKSIKITTVKPSGSLSLLAGVTPGVHAAYAPYYIRRITFAENDPLVTVARKNGYNIEPKINIDGSRDFSTMIVDFPIETPKGTQCANGYSAIQQLENQKFLQTYWSDNSVSMTCYFQPHELQDIKNWLKENYSHSMKTGSFLLHKDHGFVQAPYEEITENQYIEMSSKILPIISIIDTEQFEIVDPEECSTASCPTK